MENLQFDPVGFWLPVAVAACALYKTARTTAWWDWALLAVGVAANYATIDLSTGDLGMKPLYAWVMVPVYALAIVLSQRHVARPVLAVLFFLIVTAVVPDLLGVLIQRPELHGTFGGHGWSDGLIVVPAQFTAMYVPLALVGSVLYELRNHRLPEWRGVLKHHFRPW